MTYYGVISQTLNAAFSVTITDETGRFFGAFPARTRLEAEERLFDLLGTLRKGQEGGLASLSPR
jgi:hypothetical protein